MYIGNTLQTIRRAKRMSLTELSQKSGVQMATLSRIENMKMVGTLESHINIAKALGVDVTDLYKNIDKEQASVDFGGSSATDVFTHSDQASVEILTKNILNKKMMPALIRIEPNGKTNKEQNKNGSEKFIFLLEGAVEVIIGEQKFNLHKNNTLYFNAALPHQFINQGKSAVKILCIVTPVSL